MTTEIKEILNRGKTLICREFEKVCPTEPSLERMIKEMHNIFDKMEADLKEKVGE